MAHKAMAAKYKGSHDTESEQYEMMEMEKKKMEREYAKGYAIAICVLPEGEFTVKKIPLEYADGSYVRMMEMGDAKKSKKAGMEDDYMSMAPEHYDSMEASLKGAYKLFAEYYPTDTMMQGAQKVGYAMPNDYGTRKGKKMYGTPHPSMSGPSMHGARGGENKWGSRKMG